MAMKKILTTLLTILVLTGCVNSTPTESKKSADLSKSKIIDLTYTFSKETIYWVTAREFELDVVYKGDTDKGYFYAANNFATAEHGGTHIDAPIHFSKTGKTVEEIPLNHLMGNAIKVDVSKNALNNPDYLVSIKDFQDWEAKEGTIPNGAIIILETGFSRYYPNKLKYMGTDQRGESAVKELHFPGLSPEAAQWLVDHRNIHAIGIDTPSIDYGQSEYFKSHVILLSKNIPAFENVANVAQLPTKGFQIIALPMKIKDGTGSPLRIIAILNQ